MKRFALILAFCLPLVSFAAPLTEEQRTTILSEIAVLEAELQAIENQVHTPILGSTEATTTATTTPTDNGCSWKIGYWGQKYYLCVGS